MKAAKCQSQIRRLLCKPSTCSTWTLWCSRIAYSVSNLLHSQRFNFSLQQKQESKNWIELFQELKNYMSEIVRNQKILGLKVPFVLLSGPFKSISWSTNFSKTWPNLSQILKLAPKWAHMSNFKNFKQKILQNA